MKIEMVKYLNILIIILSIAFNCLSQTNVNLKITGLGFSVKRSEYSMLFENNIDKAGHWIFEPGLLLSYEYYVLEYDHSVRFQQGVLLDIAAQPCGYTQIYYRMRVWKVWRNSVNFGIGPEIYYRASWNRFADYKDHGDMDIIGNAEYRLMPFSAELEYDYYLSNRSDFSISVAYNQPFTITLAVGYKFWISTKIKHKRKCSTCFYNY
ncbi:MAG: hypothetical protein HY738_08855 [Bacteroidia bacterium]|nr:hypothetical protein [Bacteroidia bacterium]